MKLISAGGLYVFAATVQLSLAMFIYRQLKRGKPLPETEHHLSMEQAMQTAHTVSTVFDANMQREETEKAAQKTVAGG